MIVGTKPKSVISANECERIEKILTDNDEYGLVELILGVNRISDMRWVNKLGHTRRLKKLSMENNRARENYAMLSKWSVD